MRTKELAEGVHRFIDGAVLVAAAQGIDLVDRMKDGGVMLAPVRAGRIARGLFSGSGQWSRAFRSPTKSIRGAG